MSSFTRDGPLSPRPSHRIAKLLARAGVASRREIERMIAEGRVALNGAPIDTAATVLASLEGVTVDGEPVAAPEPTRLFLFHKPTGLLTAEHDPKGRPTIYDRLPTSLPRLIPVGRLDLNTEGLLLMTTDGELKRQLELPATGVERAYRARAYGKVSQPQLEELIEGVEIEGVRYGSIDANIERRTGTNVWIEMILKEGKNREVRRVLEHLGLQVSRLIRTRYGPFLLGDLKPGEIGEVRRHDVESFQAEPTRRDLPQPARRQATAPIELVMQSATPARREGSSPRRRDMAAPQRSDVAGARRNDAAAPRRNDEAPSAPKPKAPGRPGRPGRPAPLKDQPRKRADGSLATRGTSGRTARARTFRETRSDAEPASAPAQAPRSASPRSTGPRTNDVRPERPRSSGAAPAGPRASGPRSPQRPTGSRPASGLSGARPSSPRAGGGSGGGKPRPKTPRGAR